MKNLWSLCKGQQLLEWEIWNCIVMIPVDLDLLILVCDDVCGAWLVDPGLWWFLWSFLILVCDDLCGACWPWFVMISEELVDPGLWWSLWSLLTLVCDDLFGACLSWFVMISMERVDCAFKHRCCRDSYLQVGLFHCSRHRRTAWTIQCEFHSFRNWKMPTDGLLWSWLMFKVKREFEKVTRVMISHM